MGDRITIGSGNSNINIKAPLHQVTQKITSGANSDAFSRQRLADALAQLGVLVEQTPLEQRQDAEPVSDAATTLVEKIAVEHPNPKIVKIAESGLLEAVKSIGTLAPLALEIVELVKQIIYTQWKIRERGQNRAKACAVENRPKHSSTVPDAGDT